MEAHVASSEAALALLEERVAKLPTKGFWVAITAIQIAVVSGPILFREELQALIGI
jgi:hypothetical protein